MSECVDPNDIGSLMTNSEVVVERTGKWVGITLLAWALLAAGIHTLNRKPTPWVFFFNVVVLTPVATAVLAVLAFIVAPEFTIKRAALLAFGPFATDTYTALVHIFVALLIISGTSTPGDHGSLLCAHPLAYAWRGLLPTVVTLMAGPLQVPEILIVLAIICI